MKAEDLARRGIEKHRTGDASGWQDIWTAAKRWRASGDVPRADAAAAEARKLRFASAASNQLELDEAANRLGLTE